MLGRARGGLTGKLHCSRRFHTLSEGRLHARQGGGREAVSLRVGSAAVPSSTHRSSRALERPLVKNKQ